MGAMLEIVVFQAWHNCCTHELWLPIQDLHKIKTVEFPAWTRTETLPPIVAADGCWGKEYYFSLSRSGQWDLAISQ